MPRVSHFDIPSDNPERTQKFYKEVFDWKFEKWDGPMEYWIINTGSEKESGINGGLSKRIPGQIGITNTITVSSIDEFSKKIIENTVFEARLKNPVYPEESIQISLEEKSKEKINIICKKENGDEVITASLQFN